MCYAWLIPVAIAATQATASYVSGSKQAEAGGKAINAQLGAQENQIDAQASQQIGNETRNAWAQRAHMIVAAGEGGVSGNSIQDELKNSLTQQGLARGDIQLNAQNQKDAALEEAKSEAVGYTTPNALGGALQIGGQGYSAYENYQASNG